MLLLLIILNQNLIYIPVIIATQNVCTKKVHLHVHVQHACLVNSVISQSKFMRYMYIRRFITLGASGYNGIEKKNHICCSRKKFYITTIPHQSIQYVSFQKKKLKKKHVYLFGVCFIFIIYISFFS